LYNQLKTEFSEIDDPQFLENLNEVNFEDTLCVSQPISSKRAKEGLNVTDRSEMYTYFHLSPFARKSLAKAYFPY